MSNIDDVIKALEAIKKMLKEDCRELWYPSFIPENEFDPSGYQKQDCDSELFAYELVSQDGGGITGDDFRGDMAYPFDGWFIVVAYNC